MGCSIRSAAVRNFSEERETRRRQTAPHMQERTARKSALTQTDVSNGEKGEALRQQRGDFVRAHGNEGARGDGVVASN
jgi:hypothetical protein